MTLYEENDSLIASSFVDWTCRINSPRRLTTRPISLCILRSLKRLQMLQGAMKFDTVHYALSLSVHRSQVATLREDRRQVQRSHGRREGDAMLHLQLLDLALLSQAASLAHLRHLIGIS